MLFMFLAYTSIQYDGTYYVFQIERATIWWIGNHDFDVSII